jgi:hypothetical protein
VATLLAARQPTHWSPLQPEPEVTLERKREVLLDAERTDWLRVFPHGHNIKVAYLERRADSIYLRPVELYM